ncbi:hypothetical protein JOB18_027989 [Solea senegalensis]|uniref:Ig-like domain-containing protein n=2 Tax=Solea senegalensis TaxID=28829 RepID=A0AAV6RYX5_SOLSE|nr:uncharacterized protein LOC122782451 [Solea senegalensis]KAG7510671.1 hypothetical protein JOB18_027989 [Solea senegalensis]
MLLGFLLLSFVSESTVKSSTTTGYILATTTTTTTTMTDKPHLPLQAMAIPDYPVAAGQPVTLFCSDFSAVIWQHLEHATWQDVSHRGNLTLTQPEQSGLYRCRAEAPSRPVSRNFTVYIVDVQPTSSDILGIAAFVLSLLALIIILTLLSWLGWQRFGGGTLSTPATEVKGFPGPAKASKACSPESAGDVYMNCTSMNQAYTNLDPTNMTADNVYSSLGK